jgi:hypothetical protein
MKFLALLCFLSSCSPFFWKITDDVIEGEMKTIEQVAEDIAKNPPRPTVKIIKKRF